MGLGGSTVIVGRSLIAPTALLVAMSTVALSFTVGLWNAPSAFVGEEVVVIGPPGGRAPGRGEVDARLISPLRALPNVSVVSGETYALIAVAGRSIFVRGGDISSILEVEEARIDEGRNVAETDEVLIGRGLAERTGWAAGDTIPMPGALTTDLLVARVAGVFESEGPVRDEILVDDAAIRRLTGTAPSHVHLIRVKTSDAAALARLLESESPEYTYSNVRISSERVVAGGSILVEADLTNWGRIPGTKEVIVRVDGERAASRSVQVNPRTTESISVEVPLTREGMNNLSLNPSFAVTVVPSRLQLVAPGAARVGETVNLELLDPEGRPAPDSQILVGAESLTTDAHGRASFVVDRAGETRVRALKEGVIHAERSIFVPEEQLSAQAAFEITRLAASPDPLAEVDQAEIVVGLRNVGGVAGGAEIRVRLDGSLVHQGEVFLGSGSDHVLVLPLGRLAAGTYVLDVSIANASATLEIRSYPGRDARVGAYLESLERARQSGAASPSGPSAARSGTSYVEEVVGEARVAIVLVAVTAVTLSALGLAAVLMRHVAEGSRAIGILKAIGASDAAIIHVASREAGIYGALGAGVGVLAGFGIAEIIDRTGLIWAFGHSVQPAYSAVLFLLTWIGATAMIVVLASSLCRSQLRLPADELIRDFVIHPSPRAPPALASELGGAAVGRLPALGLGLVVALTAFVARSANGVPALESAGLAMAAGAAAAAILFVMAPVAGTFGASAAGAVAGGVVVLAGSALPSRFAIGLAVVALLIAALGSRARASAAILVGSASFLAPPVGAVALGVAWWHEGELRARATHLWGAGVGVGIALLLRPGEAVPVLSFALVLLAAAVLARPLRDPASFRAGLPLARLVGGGVFVAGAISIVLTRDLTGVVAMGTCAAITLAASAAWVVSLVGLYTLLATTSPLRSALLGGAISALIVGTRTPWATLGAYALFACVLGVGVGTLTGLRARWVQSSSILASSDQK